MMYLRDINGVLRMEISNSDIYSPVINSGAGDWKSITFLKTSSKDTYTKRCYVMAIAMDLSTAGITFHVKAGDYLSYNK